MTRVYIESALLRVEIRIFPDGDQLGVADGVRPAGVRYIYRTSNRGNLSVCPNLTRVGVAPNNIVYFFLRAPFLIKPTLDDLDAI